MADDILVDHYRRNRFVAIVGGSALVSLAAWLWLSAPPHVHDPDFLSAREERMYWVAGFSCWGVLALLLGGLSLVVARREIAADRLASLGYGAVWVAVAGAVVLYVAVRV